MRLFKPNVEKMKAKKDVKGLIKALKDEDSSARAKAADALGEIGDERAVEGLTQALKDEDAKVREKAAIALESLNRADSAKTTRFIDNGDGTITDNTTGLMWQKEDDGTKRKYDEALKHCQTLDLAGYSNWRLPRKEELRALASPGYETRKQDFPNVYERLKQDFPNIQAERYWASTSSSELYWADAPDRIAYTVDFDPESSNFGRAITYFRTYSYFVRAVRAQIATEREKLMSNVQ